MFEKLLCKLRKHNMTGPYPIGDSGEARYICSRSKCYRLIIVDVLGGGVTIYTSAENMDDPLVELIKKINKY